ncbi:MAG TPA: hypothetical protein VJP76_02645 [Candidatus Tumulicola sp.]|nr:hypothetical protein [Candidatus Tumulicola sp.]
MLRRTSAAFAFAVLIASSLCGPALADVHRFKVINNGGHQVDHIYISPISSERWGPDQLGSDEVLSPDRSITFDIDTDCEMDVRVVYHDGTVRVEKDVDTCKYDLSLKY